MLIQISLETKFHFKETIWSFGTKFAQNKYIQPQPEKMDITIEFCIFELI